MQPTERSQLNWRQRVVAFGLVVLLVGSTFASVATASPAMAFRNAEISETTVTVGENVTVSAEAINVGDASGGYTFEFERNGTDYGVGWGTFEQKRVRIAANQNRSVNGTVQFDEPGTYEIRVNGNSAGVVTVEPARARVASENDTQRRIDIRAGEVSATASTELDIPSSNRSVEVRRWSTTTGQSAFQQYITEYTDRSEAPEPLPAPAQSTLLGIVDFESDDPFQQATVQVAVDNAVLANSTLESSEVTIYQRNDSAWEPLTTTVATDGADRTVYEATPTRGTTYAVGRMNSDIAVTNTSYRTTSTASGQLLTVEAQLRNSGPVAGSYRGELQVNGETVNQTTVAVPAGAETAVSMTHEVTDAGRYNLALNRTRVGSVLIAEGQIGDSDSGTESSTTTGTAASEGTDGGGIPVPDGVPSTVLGIPTLPLVGGLAIALSAFVAILLLLRRGGGGGGGDDGLRDSFDPF